MRKLKSDEIEVKVKQVFEKGVVALLYKTARVDMDMLDEQYGVLGWQTEYKEIKGNLYCGIGVKDTNSKEWVWKWDCGIESRADGDGHEKKGEASDAFKRAGFKWGIGRELYTSPFIFIQCETICKEKDNKKYYFQKEKCVKYSVQGVWYDKDEIGALVLQDNKGNIVYQWKKQGFTPKNENRG